MAVGMLNRPGTKFGPCKNKCEHRDCAAARKQAANPCAVCLKPIGYENGYFIVDHADYPELCPQGEWKPAHAVCLEDWAYEHEQGRA